jgi:dTMP kinase
MTDATTRLVPEATPRGRFITFEGGEGVGKSTQIQHLAKRLVGSGITVTTTREPGGSPFAERLREVILDRSIAPRSAMAQALLFYAARADHLDTLIRPALAAGQWVLCDRFSDSTKAYQGAAGGLEPTKLATLDALAVGVTQPDLTVLLDLDPKIGLARASQRRTSATPGAFIAVDTFESRQLEFHQRLRRGFLTVAQAAPERVVVLDAFQNELTLADQIWQHVTTKFELASH